MTKNKKKKDQKAIAEEVAQQITARKLRKLIKLLKRLPRDFRDIDPGSSDWEAFADATDRRKEMEAWSNGPVLCLEEPNEQEKRILGKIEMSTISKTVTGPTIKLTAFSAINWCELFFLAQKNRVSWIYLPDEHGDFIKALNMVLSRMGACYRAKGQLLSERTGKPLGVVH
jgi:hypothetical protein